MRCLNLITFCLVVTQGSAQVSTLTGSNSPTDSSVGGDYVTSGVTYASQGSTITLTADTNIATGTDVSSISSINNSTVTNSNATTTATQTLLSGTSRVTSTSINGTGFANSSSSATTSAARPTNTVPCNGYPEFCSRKYSNITHIAAHNSPFVRPGNAASNQMLDVTTQLNDGIRMLQFQTHNINGTQYLCHTSCDLLNVGTLEDYLTTVTAWLSNNPHDVITILMGNYDLVGPANFTTPVRNSGLLRYVYTPPTSPMPLDSWPTLGEMIIKNQRAVVMLDYKADQTQIPWLLDEFSQMWETPFSPTNRSFPCTPQRPPDSPQQTRENRMYMANQNLNVAVDFAGLSIDVPAFPLLNETNAVDGFGSAGATVQNCTDDWNRPPNFILVDYYNLGNFNGSIFQVAASANNVTYNRNTCCGTVKSTAFHLQPSIVAIILVSCLSSLVALM